MGKEIERKFLVKDDWEDYPGLAYKHTIVQGYLASADVDSLPSSIRVRMITDLTPPNEDNKTKCYITIKSNNSGISRDEFEYEIPIEDLDYMLDNFCIGSNIVKDRYSLVLDSGQELELDRFYYDNDGLVVAEVELQNENDYIDLPDFITEEVSDDPRYFNLQLVENPYKNWK